MARRRRMRTLLAYSRKKQPASAVAGSLTADDSIVTGSVTSESDTTESVVTESDATDILSPDLVAPDWAASESATPDNPSIFQKLDNYIPFTQDVVQFVLLSLAFG